MILTQDRADHVDDPLAAVADRQTDGYQGGLRRHASTLLAPTRSRTSRGRATIVVLPAMIAR